MLAFNSFQADFENGCSVTDEKVVAVVQPFIDVKVVFLKNASWRSASGISKITKPSLLCRQGCLMEIDYNYGAKR